MRILVSSATLGLAIAACATAAQAQTVIPSTSVTVPATTVMQPARTVQTIETVRTIRPVTTRRARQIVTTRTITREVVGAPTVVARTVPVTPQPIYDEVGPGPIAASDDYDYSRPLYDSVAPPIPPAPLAATTVGAYTTIPTYRYVYEPDRILVIDPATGAAIQSIPR